MSQRIVHIKSKLSEGGSKENLQKEARDLAEDIAEFPGLEWKIWVFNEERQEAGGIYLFEDKTSAEEFVDEFVTPEAEERFGFESMEATFFEIREPLTEITGGPVPGLEG